jgi:hypothetical protein
MRCKPDYREVATSKVVENLLDTWQPLAAIAIRSGITDRLAMSILTELEEKKKVTITRARIDSHNTVVFARNRNDVVVLGMRLEVSNNESVQ